jgi:hypothetical protein
MTSEARKNAVAAIRATAEREGRREDALALLESSTADAYTSEVLDRHEWMPFLVRSALAAGRTALAGEAARAAEKDAGTRQRAECRAAALHCRGPLTEDPGPLREALEYYQGARRVPTAAECAEDLAVILATAGDLDGARVAMNESVTCYLALGATGELTRGDGRWRPLGLRRGTPSSRRRPPPAGSRSPPRSSPSRSSSPKGSPIRTSPNASAPRGALWARMCRGSSRNWACRHVPRSPRTFPTPRPAPVAARPREPGAHAPSDRRAGRSRARPTKVAELRPLPVRRGGCARCARLSQGRTASHPVGGRK